MELKKKFSIGFIGAGKVGISFGRYIYERQIPEIGVSGYYSRRRETAEYGSTKTNSTCFNQLEGLVRASDIICITVGDSALRTVWQEIQKLSPLVYEKKIFCHCSGVESSGIFKDNLTQNTDFYSYSIHPLLAVPDRDSQERFSQAFFTLEGDDAYLPFWQDVFLKLGNETCIIQKEDKVKYHAAAVFATNLVLATVKHSFDLLYDCGFSQEMIQRAFYPMMLGNVENIKDVGLTAALTGPVSRGDCSTVEKHLSVLSPLERESYLALSKALLPVAEEKNPSLLEENGYLKLKELLEP